MEGSGGYETPKYLAAKGDLDFLIEYICRNFLMEPGNVDVILGRPPGKRLPVHGGRGSAPPL